MRKAGFVLVAVALMLVAGCVTEAIVPLGGATSASPTGAVQPPPATPNIVTATGFGHYQIGVALADLRAQGLVEDVRTSPDCTGDELAHATGAHPALLYFRGGVLLAVASDSRFHKTAHGVWIGVTWDNALAAYGDRAKVLEGRGNKKSISVPEPGTEFTVLLDFDSRAGAVPLVRRILAGNAAFLEGLFGSAAKEC